MKSFREQQRDNDASTPADAIGTLAGKSEAELMAMLSAEAAKARAAGTLDADSIRAFYDSVAPMLTPEQRDKMRALLSMLG